MTAEFAFGADFSRHARHLAGKGVKLVNHRVDRIFQLKNFPFDIDSDLSGEIAAGDSRRNLGNVADLRRQISRKKIDVVGQVLPGAGDARTHSLTTEPPSVPTSRATRVTSPAKERS